MSLRCSICGCDAVERLLDLGGQPLSNRFPLPEEGETPRVPFAFGCCQNCGVARFLSPPSPGLIRPEVDWIRYNEPEGHLDDMVGRIVALDSVTSESQILGISYKEESTLRRLQERGFTKTSLLDLGIEDPRAGIETIQEQLRVERVEENCADVIIVRHVLEHAQETRPVVDALNYMLRPGGTLVYEVPDNTRLFEKRELCFLWEEHVLYFLPETFREGLGLLGYEVNWMNSYAYPVENALVAFVTPGETKTADPSVAESAYSGAEHFVSGLDEDRLALRERLSALRDAGKKIAAFGAGHLATKFINFYGLGDLLEFIVDDHPGKQGRVMAGSGLPIRPGSVLAEGGVDVLLMSLNPESEEKVVGKLAPQYPSLVFASMFRGSARSILETA